MKSNKKARKKPKSEPILLETDIDKKMDADVEVKSNTSEAVDD